MTITNDKPTPGTIPSLNDPAPRPMDGRGSIDKPTATLPLVFENVSKWYGNVIGLNKVSIAIGPGVTGLLGPNGAGKSTFLGLASGQLRPSQGRVSLNGRPIWNNAWSFLDLGLCPEQDAFYEWMTGREFVINCARLSGLSTSEAREAAASVIERVGMTANCDRPIRGYSKGMRQRTKVAQALVHDPHVLLLDEPLTGTDPIGRREMIDLVRTLGEEGRTVIVSSHVLHEVEQITQQVLLINRGRLVAVGRVQQIRDLIDKHPHRIQLRTDQPRALAALLVGFEDVLGVRVPRDEAEPVVEVETDRPDAFYERLPEIVLDHGLPIDEVTSQDASLEAVFHYLIEG